MRSGFTRVPEIKAKSGNSLQSRRLFGLLEEEEGE